jgi:hypothetical protein
VSLNLLNISHNLTVHLTLASFFRNKLSSFQLYPSPVALHEPVVVQHAYCVCCSKLWYNCTSCSLLSTPLALCSTSSSLLCTPQRLHRTCHSCNATTHPLHTTSSSCNCSSYSCGCTPQQAGLPSHYIYKSFIHN